MTEIRAGLTTFATMAYIIAVNVRLSRGMIHSISLTSRSRRSSLIQAVLVYATGRTQLSPSVPTRSSLTPARAVRPTKYQFSQYYLR